ncbi:MAG: insulinase family protein [Bacilli bacterium]|nr:insulinase family protein [Bacilli bacterium]
MKCKKYSMDGYDLYTIETDRFKTVEMKMNIRIDDSKKIDKYASMLWRMLVSTSYKYDSIKEINEACAEIYDPSFTIRAIGSGSQVVFSLSASFVNEKYTEEGMHEANIKFLSEFLFKPRIIDGAFDEEIFNIKKKKLIDYYSSMKDYPREYADHRLEEEMITLGYKVSSIDELIKMAEELSPKDLYDFYKNLMKNGKLDIFICGNFSSKEMKKIFAKNIKFNGRVDDDIDHRVFQKKYNIKPNIVIEDAPNVQSNLIVGCKCLDITEFERNYVFILYSWILGGGANCLLNQSVRENNSLCYYIYAVRKALTGVMKIYAGINGEDFDKTYELIQKEMKNMELGKFSLELFEGVKKIYYSSLISVMDYQDDMVDSYIYQIYNNGDDLEKRKKMMEKVTREDVINFAKKVHIDTVYLLRGDAK